MRKVSNICGVIHSVKDDRIVLTVRNNYVHVMFHQKITDKEKEDYKSRIGGGCSLWASKENGLIELLPKIKNVPCRVPDDNMVRNKK